MPRRAGAEGLAGDFPAAVVLALEVGDQDIGAWFVGNEAAICSARLAGCASKEGDAQDRKRLRLYEHASLRGEINLAMQLRWAVWEA